MRKKTLRMISSFLALVFLVSLFQAPMPVAAAKTATIPVTVGGQTIQVTPGQWVTVNTPGGSTSYNVRFVDGKPVAIEMSQYTKLVFGDAASTGAGTTNTGANQASSGASQTSGSANQTSSGNQTSGSANQTSSSSNAGNTTPAATVAEGASGNAAQTTTSPANTGNSGMTWNEFQKANAGKGMSSSEMSQAWKQYKQGNSGSAAQTSSGANQTSGSTAQTPAATVAEGSSTNAAQTTSTGANQTSGSVTQTSGNTAQASVTDGSATQTTSSGRTWDPSKHPRDPQTGQFISHEEAVARGLMDPADANISSNSGSSQQTAQASTDASQSSGGAAQSSSDAVQASTETAQAGTAAEAAQTSGDKGSKPSVGDKFKSGYETGKNLTKAGFQNVKDSLKSGFSAKNLLVTAGITVGVDLATQVMRGEQPSIKAALKTVCSAEFVGSVTGSVLGSAAGSFFVPFLSCIPVVGGALSALAPTFGSIVGSSVGAYTAGDLKNGRFSIKEAFKRIDWVGVTGQTIGSTVGAALGSCLGPVGTVLGGMVGGYFGNWAAHKIAGLFGKGNANLPTIATPVGTSGNSVSTAGTVTIGGSDVTSVTVSDETPVVVAAEEADTKPNVTVTSDDEVTAAYEEYTIYYTEYSKLIQSGKTEEAIAIAEKMNAAKAKYDQLRSSESE